MSRTSSKTIKEKRQVKRQRQHRLWQIGGGLAGVAVLIALGYFVWDVVRPRPGQGIPWQSRTHIQVGDSHEPYNSDPPTSGPHAGPATAGFHSQPLPDENLVHNLEHGYVVLWYNCKELSENACNTLKRQIRNVIASGGKKLIAVPRDTLDTQIALTSWGRLYKLDSFDEEKITTFIQDFRGKAPEGGAP